MTFVTTVPILFTSFVYRTNVYWSVIYGIKRNPHLSVVWNWYDFVAIAILHQPRPTDSANINTRLQLSDTSSIPPMQGGFLLICMWRARVKSYRENFPNSQNPFEDAIFTAVYGPHMALITLLHGIVHWRRHCNATGIQYADFRFSRGNFDILPYWVYHSVTKNCYIELSLFEIWQWNCALFSLCN